MKAILLKNIRKWIEATVVNLPKKIFEKITQFNESWLESHNLYLQYAIF